MQEKRPSPFIERDRETVTKTEWDKERQYLPLSVVAKFYRVDDAREATFAVHRKRQRDSDKGRTG